LRETSLKGVTNLYLSLTAVAEINRGSGSPFRGVSWPPKIWNWGQKLHMALMLDRCDYNDHFTTCRTLIH